MADDRSEPPDGKSGDKAPATSPLTERSKAAGVEAVRNTKGLITDLQDAKEKENKTPSHVPDATEEDDASNAKGRDKSPGQHSMSFEQRLEQLREMLPSIGMPDHCREAIDLDGL